MCVVLCVCVYCLHVCVCVLVCECTYERVCVCTCVCVYMCVLACVWVFVFMTKCCLTLQHACLCSRVVHVLASLCVCLFLRTCACYVCEPHNAIHPTPTAMRAVATLPHTPHRLLLCRSLPLHKLCNPTCSGFTPPVPTHPIALHIVLQASRKVLVYRM